MKYVDWITRDVITFEEEKNNYKYWEDLVTETRYCISEEEYKRIYNKGKEKLEQYLMAGDLEAIEKIFYQPQETDDNSFSSLPYFIANQKKCARICDYVCFRTACLYALKYESIQNSADIEGEKKKLRMQGFTWGFVENAEKNIELEQIEQALSQKKNGTIDMLLHKADFVKGGIVKIKQYYLETNKIPEIRGASLLLDMINNEKMGELVEQIHIRECMIYAGGGKMMGIFPKGTGDEICLKMRQLIEEETVTAQSNFCSLPYEMGWLIDNYKKAVEQMDLMLEERQGLRWDFRIEPQVRQKVSEEFMKMQGFKRIHTSGKEFCTSCRNRYAAVEYLYHGSDEKLCQSCLYKKLEGGRNARSSIYEKYREYVRKKYDKHVSERGNRYNKLEDIAENGFIGVIYGDANSMSSQINNLNSFMMMRYFSQITSDTVTDIVFDALFLNLNEEPSFEVIAVGGDDIFLIVPGNKAYDIACTIGQLFDKRFQNQSTEEKKMTMSVGVCITHHNMPVQYSFGIAQELLKSAKQKAWEERQKGNATGTIDWVVIENEMAGSSVLEYQRRGRKDKPEMTLRPYTWEQSCAMKKFMNQIKTEKSFAFQLRQSWYQHTKEEAELFFEYQIARKKDTKIRNALDGFAKALNGTVEKNNVVCQGKPYSPWLDVVELWDYVEGME